MLATTRRGSGPPLVFLHGFGQDSTCLGPVADGLEASYTVLRVDLPRHGGSRPVHGATFEDDAALLAALVDEPAVWLGYSLGGRYALRVALDHPHRVRALITVGASPGLLDEGARAARRADDAALAAELVRDGVARFFDAWLARPMFEGLSEPMRFRAARERQDPAALAASLVHAGTGAMQPLHTRLAALTTPALLLAGERDAKFVREAEFMARAIGAHAEVAVVEGAGHAAHLEAPEATLAVVRAWLARHHLTTR